jgi:hypothetical protein
VSPTIDTTVVQAPQLDTLDWLSERFEAAHALWALGHTAESYALLHQALTDAVARLRMSRGVPSDELRAVEALLTEAQALDPPRSRSDFDREHAAWLERARSASHRLQRALRKPRAPLSRARVIALCALAVAVIAVAGRVWHRQVYASASAVYGPEHSADNATDGLRVTEWVLPDNQLGYLDLTFAARRAVHGVTLINAHNRWYMDRAIKRGTVMVYDDQKIVDQRLFEFDAVKRHPARMRVPLNGARGTRVRVLVMEHFGLSGGLAEVEVD